MPAQLPGMSHKCVCIALMLFACGQGVPAPVHVGPRWPPARTGYVNPIAAENQAAGDASWNQFIRSVGGQVEAYAERVSAKAGEDVRIMARSSPASPASWTLDRLRLCRRARRPPTGAGHPPPRAPPALRPGLDPRPG